MQVQRESIFISAIRSFCRAFFAICGVFLAFFIFSSIYSAIAGSSLVEEKTRMTVLSDASGKRELVSFSAPAILQLNIHGPIGIDLKDVNSETIENILVDSRTGLLSHDRVKGILLHINSPGGTVIDSDDIYSMLLEYKKRYNVPVFAYVDGMCASGAMYIASAADQIYASPSSAIGSVGVIFGPFFNVSGTLAKLGMEAKTLTEGLDKDALNPTRPWREGEDQWIKNLMSFSYDRFVSIVTEARPKITKEELVNVYGAKMFNSVEAEKLGYVDHSMSNREEALLALLDAAHINPASPYQVVELQSKQSLLGALVSGSSPLISGTVEHTFDFNRGNRRYPFSYLYQPQ